MKAEQPGALRFTSQSFGIWVCLTVVAFFLGADLHLQAEGPTTPFNPRDFELALVGFVFGAVSGLIIGSLQWIALKSWIPNARRWMLVNAVGFGLVHALHDAVPYRPLDLWLILIIDGAIIGLAQYFALGRSLLKSPFWVPIFSAAWFLGFQSGLALAIAFVQGNPLGERLFVNGSAGLIVGVTTGIMLKFLIIPVNPPPAQISRWAKMRISKKILLVSICAVAAVVLLIFAGMMMGIG